MSPEAASTVITPSRLATAVRTLVAGGFALESVTRNPGYALLLMRRSDEFGAQHLYAFAVADERPLSGTEVAAASTAANYHGAELVVIGQADASGPLVEWERFVNLFGGPVHSTTPLDPDFSSHLVDLGHNRMPAGLEGRADDLFESYVHSGLEFVFAGRVIRYGQERRFEPRADGIVIPREQFRALYDAKAYSGGYSVSADSMRQFRSYVDDFVQRYQPYLQQLNSFIVISGSFVEGEDALRERHQEFIATAHIPLSFMTASTLADIVAMMAQTPTVRRAVNWARVFAAPIVDVARVRAEVTAVHRDGIIARG